MGHKLKVYQLAVTRLVFWLAARYIGLCEIPLGAGEN
jgi:hypothetical protein